VYGVSRVNIKFDPPCTSTACRKRRRSRWDGIDLADKGPLGEVFDRWAIFGGAFEKPNEYNRFIHDLPDDVVNIIAVECLFGDVLNGGFDQYFSNSGGVSVREAIRGLRDMGLDEYAEIASDALAVLGDKFVQDRAERCSRMYAETPGYYATDIFDHLDIRFYDLDRVDDRSSGILEKYAVEVLRRHGN
jgi:hypothetical protein